MPPAPLAGIDRALAAPRSAVVRVLAWAATDYVLLLACAAVGYLLVAVPPLSLLPSEEPLSLPDSVLLSVTYGSVGWPVHLAVVAAVSRARRARLWVLLASPLLGAVAFGLPYLLAYGSHTARSAVVAWTLYGLVCRLMPPGRRRSAAPAARPAR